MKAEGKKTKQRNENRKPYAVQRISLFYSKEH